MHLTYNIHAAFRVQQKSCKVKETWQAKKSNFKQNASSLIGTICSFFWCNIVL